MEKNVDFCFFLGDFVERLKLSRCKNPIRLVLQSTPVWFHVSIVSGPAVSRYASQGGVWCTCFNYPFFILFRLLRHLPDNTRTRSRSCLAVLTRLAHFPSLFKFIRERLYEFFTILRFYKFAAKRCAKSVRFFKKNRPLWHDIRYFIVIYTWNWCFRNISFYIQQCISNSCTRAKPAGLMGKCLEIEIFASGKMVDRRKSNYYSDNTTQVHYLFDVIQTGRGTGRERERDCENRQEYISTLIGFP